MLSLSRLYIYPIKSLGGISLQRAQVTDRGLQYDRRWMLVDEHNRFMTQRSDASMALFQLGIEAEGLSVLHRSTGASFTIPFEPQTNEELEVAIWDDTCRATVVSESANEFFSDGLKRKCRLVYMPDDSLRPVDRHYAKEGEITSFSDAYPFLLISQASLDHLNERLQAPVSMDRFRPNFVINGSEPHAEDFLQHFTINDIHFYGVKLCARCAVPTIDQQTGIKGKELMATLAHYRRGGDKVYFGQNLIHKGAGTITLGDAVNVVQRGEPHVRIAQEDEAI